MAGTALRGSTVENLRGADALRGVVIGSDQAAFPVFATVGIVIDDDYSTRGRPPAEGGSEASDGDLLPNR